MKGFRWFTLLTSILLSSFWVPALHAQNQMGNKKLRFYLAGENDKDRWLQFSTFIQFWGRVTENNPGTTVNGVPQEFTSDISIRRFRLGLGAQPVKKLYTFFQLGVNNLNYLSPRGTSVDLLDAYVQYELSPFIALGGGKSFWNGLSRFTSPSTSKLMGYDLNFVASPTLGSTDDLIRRLSMYAKGKVGAIDYRFVVTKPLSAQNSSAFDAEPVEGIARFTDNRPNLQFSGYAKYEFWEPERNLSPAQVGTYLGSKKVFNLGAGFTYQKDALWSLDEGQEGYHDMKLFALDVFMDLPLQTGRRTALTGYVGYFNFDFGPDYIRLLGANNPTNGVAAEEGSFNGKGNTFPISGTGSSLFAQLGYLFAPMGKVSRQGQLQPYITGQYSNFERFASPMFYYDLGMNWYLNGHLSKLTLNAENRPIFYNRTDGLSSGGRKWMFVLQYQFRID
ncbi:porin [Maribacter litoralis]|uniref:porin n=1 Tax=Maribacter litoralis TaxID=2059726 RepID=UPI003F5CF468